MRALCIPTVPNSPLSSMQDEQAMGTMRLHRNMALNFIENAEFDPSLATYDDNYQNSQTNSPLFLRHMEDVLSILKKLVPPDSRMVEVGCGKGDFVELARADGYFKASGFDATYEGSNPQIEKRYIKSGDNLDADLIVVRHVLEHIQAPHQFLEMLKHVFKKAKIYIEVPNYEWITENHAFFDITYEHVNYFTPGALLSLFDNKVTDCGLCFGGQYQYIVADIDALSDHFANLYVRGPWEDLDFDILFPDISAKIASIESNLGPNGKLYIWGAATKGCMFLVHCAHRNQLIDRVAYAIDINPQKCGKFLPGTLVPIKQKHEFFRDVKSTDVLLISNPNYRDEILLEIESHGIKDVMTITL